MVTSLSFSLTLAQTYTQTHTHKYLQNTHPIKTQTYINVLERVSNCNVFTMETHLQERVYF